MGKGRNRRYLLKVVSLLFSIFLWLYVLSSADVEFEKAVQIRYSLPPGKALASEYVKEVIYYLKGPRAFMRALQNREDIITIDLTKKSKRRGHYEVVFKSSDVKLPFGVITKSIEPKKLEIKLEKKIKKSISLKANLVGDLPKGQKLVSYTVTPKKVLVSGPVSLVEEMDNLETTAIDISELSGQSEKVVELQLNDERLSFVEQIEQATFSYIVRPRQSNMLLKQIPIRFFTTKSFKRPQIRNVSLKILSDSGADADIDKSLVQVLAEIPDGAKGNTQVELKAKLPEGFHLMEIQPANIFVYVY